MKTAHVYLNDREHDGLRRIGEEYGLSDSGVLRLGLRAIAGLPIPARFRELALEQLNEGGPREATPIAS